MQLQWQHWSESTKSMTGLEDSVRYDLSSPFSRKMEPAYEAFYRCSHCGLRCRVYLSADVLSCVQADRQQGRWLRS